jgi:Tol biopolymer transport system component
MKNLFTFALLLIFGICFSQIITGNIENEAGNPVSNVNIYVDGSKISTVSASDGSFSIDIQNLKNGNLVFQKETLKAIPSQSIKHLARK